MNTMTNTIDDTMQLNNNGLSDSQKLAKLKELGEIIEMEKTNNDSQISDQMRCFITGALYIIEECNESWCDHCEVRKALNCLCCEI